MTETKRTVIFVGVAALSLGAATITHFSARPKPSGEYEKVGTEFYPDFADPADAQSLRVVVFNEETATVKPFTVEFKDGRWRIPSHHDYPADGKDRLARTAASIIGIRRDGLQSRRESDHARYGVVTPDSEDVTDLKGRGQRITLTKADGTVLADYIIGNKVEGQEDQYYVRSPKEKETYRARLKIDLSTKFGDWIEPDLLKVDRDSLNEIVVDKYSIDEQRLRIVNREISELTRAAYSDPWKLKGLNEETEEVNTGVVSDMVNHLDDLRIVGVRPKPPGIRPDLSLDPKIGRDPLVRNALQADLQSKGFLVGEDQKGNLHLFSNEGEMTAGTNEGVRYALHFGEIFTGSEFEVEVGFADSKDDKAEGGKDQDGKDDDKSAEEKKADGEKKDDAKADDKNNKNLKRSRYLFVTAAFDQKLVGAAPTKPTEPVKPAGLEDEKPADDKSAEQKKDSALDEKPADPAANEPANKPAEDKPAKPDAEKSEDQSAIDPFGDDELDEAATVPVALVEAESDAKSEAEPADKPEPAASDSSEKPEAKSANPADKTEPASSESSDKPEPAQPESKPADGKAAAKPVEATRPDPKAEYEKALAQYKKDLEKYENDLSQYNSKIEKGKKKADELNKRFSGWYYVISAESFETLRLSRKDLVQPKGTAAEKNASPGGGLPSGLPPGFPGLPGNDPGN